MLWETLSVDWPLLNATVWNTVPVLAVVVAIAAAIGFGPLLLRKRATVEVTAVANRAATTSPRQAIVEVFDAENVDDIAMAHVVRLLRDGKLELAKTALELAIAQRGQP